MTTIQAPTFRKETLDNGLTIIAEVIPGAHSAAAGFFVCTGARDEAPELMGVSHFLEHMMFKGTEELTAEAINQGFDDLGARNNAYTTGEMTAFHAHVLPEKLPEAVDLLGKMMRPAIRQADFDTEKKVILEEIAMYADNPFWVLYEACVERRYDGHGLAHRVLGTNESVGGMLREGMVGYFNERYSADNTTLALAGDLDFDRVVEQARTLCGDWPRTGATRSTTPPLTHEHEFELRDERVSRGYLIMLSPGPSANDEDRYAAAALAQVLGGSDSSRLHWALIETGLADEAQAAFDGHVGIGDMFVYASGEPSKLDEIAKTIDREMENLVGSLNEDDLVRLRARMETAAIISGERPDGRMHRIGRRWTQLGTYSTLEEEVDRIGRVTLDDLARVAERYPYSSRVVGRLVPAK